MKKTRIDKRTKGILAGEIYNYLHDNKITHRVICKSATNPFPVGTGLLREILHRNKRVVKFQPSKQLALLKFFGIDKDFYYDVDTKNYIPIEPNKRTDKD